MSGNLPALSINLNNIGSVETFISHANAIPMLTQAEEAEFARRWYEEGCKESARRLVLAHLRFVIKVARGYNGYGLQLADLIQEGNIGLMKAVKRFDPNVGVRLVSFAVHWIKSEIHEFIIKNWRIVKVATTKAQRKLFFNLRSSKKRLGWFTEDEIYGVADALGVPIKDVREMEARLNAHDAAFDAPSADTSEQNTLPSPSEYLEDASQDPAVVFANSHWQTQATEALGQALQQLNQREQAIISDRWLVDKKLTLQELAEKHGVSAERVRQIEQAAIKKLKTNLLPQLESQS